MFHGVKPEHQQAYILQADEVLDDLDGEALEERVQRVICEYCHLPFLAQYEIDAIVELFPRFEKCPPLDAVYALRTLVRSRRAIADLLVGVSDQDIERAMENMGDPTEAKDGDADEPNDQAENVDDVCNKSVWGGKQFDEDIRRSAFRRSLIENGMESTMNEKMLKLEDLQDPAECFRMATRRLSIAIIDTCTGDTSQSQYRASISSSFPRMKPLMMTGLVSSDTIFSVAAGLITDINSLPGPGDDPFSGGTV